MVGTYLHGLLDNGSWRRHWLSQLRRRKGLDDLAALECPHRTPRALDGSTRDAFEAHIDIKPLLNAEAGPFFTTRSFEGANFVPTRQINVIPRSSPTSQTLALPSRWGFFQTNPIEAQPMNSQLLATMQIQTN